MGVSNPSLSGNNFLKWYLSLLCKPATATGLTLYCIWNFLSFMALFPGALAFLSPRTSSTRKFIFSLGILYRLIVDLYATDERPLNSRPMYALNAQWLKFVFVEFRNTTFTGWLVVHIKGAFYLSIQGFLNKIWTNWPWEAITYTRIGVLV